MGRRARKPPPALNASPAANRCTGRRKRPGGRPGTPDRRTRSTPAGDADLGVAQDTVANNERSHHEETR